MRENANISLGNLDQYDIEIQRGTWTVHHLPATSALGSSWDYWITIVVLVEGMLEFKSNTKVAFFVHFLIQIQYQVMTVIIMCQ